MRRKAAWIDKTERLPTAADADCERCVLAWHRYSGMMVTGIERVAQNDFFTHWMPALEPPEGMNESGEPKGYA